MAKSDVCHMRKRKGDGAMGYRMGGSERRKNKMKFDTLFHFHAFVRFFCVLSVFGFFFSFCLFCGCRQKRFAGVSICVFVSVYVSVFAYVCVCVGYEMTHAYLGTNTHPLSECLLLAVDFPIILRVFYSEWQNKREATQTTFKKGDQGAPTQPYHLLANRQ